MADESRVPKQIQMQAVLAGLKRERSMIGSGMLLRCVYLKLLKGGERFKMSTASKQTRMSPAPSVMFLETERLKQKQCGRCPANQPYIVNRPEFLTQLCKFGSTQMLICQMNRP